MVNQSSKKAERKKPARKPAAKAGLSDRQKRFVAEYLVDRNATQAGIRAGYSPKTAQAQTSRLLSNVMIRAAVDAGLEKVAARLELTAENILAEMAKIAFSDMRRVVKWGKDMRPIYDKDGVEVGRTSGVGVIGSDEIDADIAAAISEVSESKDGIKVKLHSKVDALTKLGTHLGLFKDKGEVEHSATESMRQFIAAMQGHALPLGHVQPIPPAPPTTTASQTGAAQAQAPAAPVLSPLMRPPGAR